MRFLRGHDIHWIWVGVIFLSGCSHAHHASSSVLPAAASVDSTMAVKPGHQAESPVSSEIVNRPISVPVGKIFAKTDFEGVLKTDYVELSFVNLQDEEQVYRLRIGQPLEEEENVQNAVPLVRPGYFSFELPAGIYAFRMISIPVGTSFASEPIKVVFEVVPDQIVYLGTLKVVGTKEKIKLGGVPVIQPGFEYTIDVLNEKEEAQVKMKEFFPEHEKDLPIRLMRVKSLDDDFFLPLVSSEFSQREKKTRQ